MRWIVALLLSATLARADGNRAGEFNYYVLALSWSPTWCALEGDARRAAECDVGAARGWTLHGLWPQNARGWPSECHTGAAPPSRAMTARMADIMGSSGLARHEWREHGTCSGHSAKDYFALARRAYDGIIRPAVFRKLPEAVRLPARVVEQAFIKANPALEPDMITIKCQRGRIHEVRICLSKSLEPVPCGQDIVRDCSLKRALMDSLR